MVKRRKPTKVNKKSNKGKALLIVTLLFTIVIYYEVIVLVEYTLGKPVKSSKLKIYNYVTEKIYKTDK